MSRDLIKFGLALKSIRERKDVAHKVLLERIRHRYSDSSSYRRIERGERTPERETIIDILIVGLEEKDGSTIDELLAFAGYDGLSEREAEELGVQRAAPSIPDASDGSNAAEQSAPAASGDEHLSPVAVLTLSCVVGSCLILAVLICAWAHATPLWFVTLTAVLYGSLYGVSILLETAYHARTAQIQRLAVAISCFTVLAAVTAFAADAFLITDQANGLIIGIAVILVAAAAQWFVARRYLPAHAIVPATFQPHTGQSAHLKNTTYFLFIVVAFLQPPWHSAAPHDRHIN
jgi:hypothetical protein